MGFDRECDICGKLMDIGNAQSVLPDKIFSLECMNAADNDTTYFCKLCVNHVRDYVHYVRRISIPERIRLNRESAAMKQKARDAKIEAEREKWADLAGRFRDVVDDMTDDPDDTDESLFEFALSLLRGVYKR